ncbi:MAG: 3'(2'),5'-bisphosphate nucleotidase CysQ [Terriglobia bacterium]
MNETINQDVLGRIQEGLDAAVEALKPFVPGAVKTEYKSHGDPVTEADRVVDHLLHNLLVRDGEGWLSEESADNLERLEKDRVWIVDPLDGTREFVEGIPEWCVSIALVEKGKAIAGGIANPATEETFLGLAGSGLLYNRKPAKPTARTSLADATVLASRSEVKRGEWKEFEGGVFSVRPMGSIAYKLARVAAGLADVTWTLTPKHEWDVAAGVALVEAAGGMVTTLAQAPLAFNNASALLPGLIASGAALRKELASFLAPYLAETTSR